MTTSTPCGKNPSQQTARTATDRKLLIDPYLFTRTRLDQYPLMKGNKVSDCEETVKIEIPVFLAL